MVSLNILSSHPGRALALRDAWAEFLAIIHCGRLEKVDHEQTFKLFQDIPLINPHKKSLLVSNLFIQHESWLMSSGY